MFTGLVEDKGKVLSLSTIGDAAILEIETSLASQISLGDSISVNGVCLTATEVDASSFKADVMIQTLKLTNLGELKKSEGVNLELATRVEARLGGHIVQGHVDGVGRVLSNTPGEKWNQFDIEVPDSISRYIVNQGSIAVDGVSLTVGEITGSKLTLWLIPETLAKTNLGDKNPGDSINIEVDILAKYVEKLMRRSDD